MGPIVTQLAADYAGRALMGTVDGSEQHPVCVTWRVNGYPTYLFFNRGSETARLSGKKTYQELAAQIDALIAAR